MASSISAGTTSSTALVATADTTGALELKTNNGTTALTLSTAQNATFAGAVTTNTIGSAAATALTVQSAGTTALTVDTSQNVFVGGTTQNTATKPVYASTTAKAWVNFNSSGGINGSFNVSSVTRTSTGNFEVNFSSAMPNANYAATANSWQSVSNNNVSYNVFSFTTAKYQITTFENSAGTNPNATYSIVFAT